MNLIRSSWQEEEVAYRFLDEVRGAVPYGPDQVLVMLQLVERFRPDPRFIVDLGCGDGILAQTLLDAFPEAHALLLDHSEPMLPAQGTGWSGSEAAAAYDWPTCTIRWTPVSSRGAPTSSFPGTPSIT